MWRFVSFILAFTSIIWLAAAQGVQLTALCPSIVDNTIDGSFKQCRSSVVTLLGPRDYKLYTFQYGVDPDVSVSFTVRAIVGSVRATITSADTPYSATTLEGPAFIRLQPDSGGEDWSLRVESAQGLPSRFVVEIDTSSTKLTASNATRALLASMFEECCDSTPDSADPFINRQPLPTPCRLLSKWTNATTAQDDVCQSDYAHCTPQGALDVLMLRSFVVKANDGSYAIPPAFNDQCTQSPPSTLSKFTELTHLEMFAMALQWTVSDLVEALKPLSKLEQLYLGYNQIDGELDAEACSLFVGTPLQTLSFRNPIELDVPYGDDSPPWNSISGDLHPCIFNSSLENLNLVMNQISSVPSIPDAKTITGALKTLRLYSQMDPSDEYNPTMAGKGVPKGLENLKQLQFVGLAGNQLGGSLEDIIIPPSVEWLDLSDNDLSGEIPDLSKQYSQLSTLMIGYNEKLTGDITKIGIESLTGLVLLDISNTSISGTPSSVDWSKLSNLEVLDASGTQLEGEIPASLAKLSYLQELVFSENPKITSQTSFANALTADNNITFYDVHSCSIVDLPDNLRNLKFFQAQYMNILKADAWVFDITDNDIEQELPLWLVAPLQQPKALFTSLQSDPEALGTDIQYVFAIQLNVGNEPDGNRLGCPNEPVPETLLQYAAELQFLNTAQYNALVNCYNGTEEVPVATYLAWLQTHGALPAPPPYTSSSRTGGISAQSKAGSEGSKKSGPSAGALAGIVVGVLVGVAILAAAVFVVIKVVVPKMKQKSFVKFQETDAQGVPSGPYGNPDQFQMAVQAPQGANAV